MSDVHAPTTRSFRPGDWFAVLGERTTVILPPSEKPRIGALWEMVDAGAGFDEVLDTLIADGLRSLPGFVLVGSEGDTTRVVVRGDARARFVSDGEEVHLDGTTASTWVERSLPGVTSLSVEVAEEGGDADLCLAHGLVRISRLDQPPRATTTSDPREPATTVAEEPEPAVEPPAVDEEATQAVPFLVDVPDEPEAQSGATPDQASYDDDPTVEPPIWAPQAAPPPAPPFGPPSTPPPPVPPAEASDHDGMTRAGDWDPGQFARQQPGIPGQPPAPSVTARPVARLVFSSGETVDVDRAVLVGRAPEARRFTSTEQPRLVTVPSPNQEVSSTHLEIRPGSGADHGSAVVTDMGSTNGTVVVQPGLPPEDLQPGIAVQLIPGAVVDLGDGVSISVTNP